MSWSPDSPVRRRHIDIGWTLPSHRERILAATVSLMGTLSPRQGTLFFEHTPAVGKLHRARKPSDGVFRRLRAKALPAKTSHVRTYHRLRLHPDPRCVAAAGAFFAAAIGAFDATRRTRGFGNDNSSVSRDQGRGRLAAGTIFAAAVRMFDAAARTGETCRFVRGVPMVRSIPPRCHENRDQSRRKK